MNTMNLNNSLLLLFLFIYQFSIGQSNQIKINYKINPDKSISFNYVKKVPGSYTLYLSFPKLTNTYPTNFKGVIKYNSGNLLSLSPLNKNRPISFSYNVSYIQGIINPKKIDKDFVYTLPFKTDTQIEVKELGNLAEKYFNTNAPKNWKSYQFITTKDTVLSVRKGLVVKVINKYTIDNSNYYTTNRNSILVEQPDGSFINYSNFKKNGILVKEGQTIYPHTPIGILPNTKTNSNSYLFLGIYYLSNPNFNKRNKNSFKFQQNIATYITPKFITDTGIKTLQTNTKYLVKFNNDLYCKEFSKKEKRKYKKGIHF